MTASSPSAPARAGISPWRVPAMWLVVGGPAIVVLASVTTGVLAARGADPVVRAPRVTTAAPVNTLPAEVARNHVNVPRH